jgi:AraC-like DNA-binding protein
MTKASDLRQLNPGIPVSWIRTHFAAARNEGLDTDSLIMKYSPKVDFDNRRAILSGIEQLAIILDMLVSIGDESHGYCERRAPLGYNSLMLRTMMSATTVFEAVDIAARYLRMTDGPVKLYVEHADTHTDIVPKAVKALQQAESFEEIWALWLDMCLSWLVGERIRPLAMLTSNAAHPALGKRHWLINAPVLRARGTGLRLARTQMKIRIRERTASHPTLSSVKFFMENSGSYFPALQIAKITSGLDMFPKRKIVQMDELCADLSISPSALRRRLSDQGVSFRELRREAVVAAVCERLIVSDDTGDELAEHVGFSEVRSLRRMLKVSTGMTLGELREHMRHARGPIEVSALQTRCLQFAKMLDD